MFVKKILVFVYEMKDRLDFLLACCECFAMVRRHHSGLIVENKRWKCKGDVKSYYTGIERKHQCVYCGVERCPFKEAKEK